MQERSKLTAAIADMLRGNIANPFFEGPEPTTVDLLQAAEQVLDKLAATSLDDFPIHADSHGVRFYMAPGGRQHRLFALIWDGRMWRTGAEFPVPHAALNAQTQMPSGR